MGVIAIAGLSGVGKSTFLRAMAARVDFHHLIASDLIKAELARLDQGSSSSEELRLGAVVDNQQLLVKGFLQETAATTLPIVLDGHVLIDGKGGLIPIPSDVFRQIGTKHLVFLQDEPSTIRLRRTLDQGRLRPSRTVEELGEQQDLAIKTAAKICRELSIDMLLLTPAVPELLEQLLLTLKVQASQIERD
jgi:adenylate kinase